MKTSGTPGPPAAVGPSTPLEGEAGLAVEVLEVVREVERALDVRAQASPLFRNLRVRVTRSPAADALVHLRLSVAYGVVLPRATSAIDARIREHLCGRLAIERVALVIDYEDLYFQAV